MEENNSTELALIKKCIKNDSKAQFELYNKYAQAMYSLSVRILGNNDDAQDALQDSFIKAFKSIPTFDGRVTFGAWLRKITINTCLNKLRKNKLQWVELQQEFPEEVNNHELKIDEFKLNKAIERLPKGCRAIFTLKAIEGLEHQEIANYLNISISTSKSQFKRAKELLRQTLQNPLS